MAACSRLCHCCRAYCRPLGRKCCMIEHLPRLFRRLDALQKGRQKWFGRLQLHFPLPQGLPQVLGGDVQHCWAPSQASPGD